MARIDLPSRTVRVLFNALRRVGARSRPVRRRGYWVPRYRPWMLRTPRRSVFEHLGPRVHPLPRTPVLTAHGAYWCPDHGWTAEPHVLTTVAGDDGEDHAFTPRLGGTMAARTGAPHLYDHPPIPAEGRPVKDDEVAAPRIGPLINPGITRAARRGWPPYFIEDADLPTPTPASPEADPSPPRCVLRRTATDVANWNPTSMLPPSTGDLNAYGGGDAFFSPDEGESSRT